MKYIYLMLLLLASSVYAQTGPATQIVSTWTLAAYPAGTVNCSATVQSNCALGYTLTITPPTGTAIVIPPCTQTVTTGCISATTTTYTYQGSSTGLPYGTYTGSLVTNALGSIPSTGGKASVVSSAPLTASWIYALTSNTIPVPGGFIVTFTN